MSAARTRVFVPPGSAAGGRLRLSGDEAARVAARGVRAGEAIEVLDDSGWALDVVIDACAAEACTGRVTGRRIARERRTKVSLYQGLLHPSDFRRLLTEGTRLGAVAFVPLVTDQSMVPALGPDGRPEGESSWPDLVREAAESGGRGRRPVLRPDTLFDHALDSVLHAGAIVLLDPRGAPLDEALADRPFSIDLLAPPPSGFSPGERQRARARGGRVVRAPVAGPDPVQPALSALAAIYGLLESASESSDGP